MKKAKTPLRKITKSAKRIDSEAPTLDTVPNVVAITAAFFIQLHFLKEANVKRHG